MTKPAAQPATNVRDATESDARPLADLLATLGYPVEAAEVPRRLERFVGGGNGRVLLAEEDGAVLGFAALEITNPIHHAHPVAHLAALAVVASARRKGIGRKLLRAVETAARAEGCLNVVVTSADHRADAHAFYPAAGWGVTGRRFGKKLDGSGAK